MSCETKDMCGAFVFSSRSFHNEPNEGFFPPFFSSGEWTILHPLLLLGSYPPPLLFLNKAKEDLGCLSLGVSQDSEGDLAQRAGFPGEKYSPLQLDIFSPFFFFFFLRRVGSWKP